MKQGRVVGHQEWATLSVPDVYFTLEYNEASGLLEPGFSRTVLLEWRDENGTVRLPLIIREIFNEEHLDATSAYGYGGPWIEGNPNLAHFIDYFNQWALENNIICSFLRFHPLIKNAEKFQEHIPIQQVGPTAGWNLNKPGELVDGMAKNHRKTFRRALRSGVEARVSVNPTESENFRTLYKESMDRLSAAEFYRFSDPYWLAMEELLGDSTVLVEAIYEERVVAAVWCLTSEHFLHYHLSGTSDEGRKLGGAVLCRVAAAQWARDRGLSLAHFGGGIGGESSTLLTWKQRFDEALPAFDFCISKIVHEEKVYGQLAAGYENVDFFPPWRAPQHDISFDK